MIEPGIMVVLCDGVGNAIDYPVVHETRQIALTGALIFERSFQFYDNKRVYFLVGYGAVEVRHLNQHQLPTAAEPPTAADPEC